MGEIQREREDEMRREGERGRGRERVPAMKALVEVNSVLPGDNLFLPSFGLLHHFSIFKSLPATKNTQIKTNPPSNASNAN